MKGEGRKKKYYGNQCVNVVKQMKQEKNDIILVSNEQWNGSQWNGIIRKKNMNVYHYGIPYE